VGTRVFFWRVFVQDEVFCLHPCILLIFTYWFLLQSEADIYFSIKKSYNALNLIKIVLTSRSVKLAVNYDSNS
jgi:hypothetical protein